MQTKDIVLFSKNVSRSAEKMVNLFILFDSSAQINSLIHWNELNMNDDNAAIMIQTLFCGYSMAISYDSLQMCHVNIFAATKQHPPND